MPTPEQHALLSASSAHMWLHCPPSAQLGAQQPDRTSPDAERGRLAHAIAELKLRKRYVGPMGPKTFAKQMDKLKADPLYGPEMDKATDEYLDAIEDAVLAYPEKPFVTAEQRVDFSRWVPEGFGTADCILIGSGILHVIDYKNGAGVPVDAEANPQMMLYALGALARYEGFYRAETVRMTIVQPHAGGVKSAELPAAALLDWANNVLAPAALRAFTGQGAQTPGDWCRFCRVKAQCRARNRMEQLEAFGQDAPELYSDADLGAILDRARGLAAWVKDVEDYVLRRSLDGHPVPGWKAVAGRAVREFDDPVRAEQQLIAAGIDKELLYVRRPLTLAQVEKIVGKKEFTAIVGDRVVTPPGKPTLVPDTDPRPAYCAAAEAFKNEI